MIRKFYDTELLGGGGTPNELDNPFIHLVTKLIEPYTVDEGFCQPITTTPPDELDREAQSLIESFYKQLTINLTEVNRHSTSDILEHCKQCAIIHCDLMIEELKRLLVPATDKYTTLKAKIESL